MEEENPPISGELVETGDDDFDRLDELVPQLNVTVPTSSVAEPMFRTDEVVGLCNKILDKIDKDEVQLTEFVDNFSEMVINQGDSTTSSKEALVNFVKMRLDQTDKYAKVLDMMTRVVMKDRGAGAPQVSASQTNNMIIDRRRILASVKQEKKKGK